MSHRSPSLSRTSRFSREGFQPLDGGYTRNNMNNPNDATINIPLTEVQAPTRSPSGARRPNNEGAGSPSEEVLQPPVDSGGGLEKKRSIFHRRRGDHAGRRRVTSYGAPGEATGANPYDGEKDTLTRMGKIYNKILNFSIITRFFVYISPLAIAIAIPIIIGATVAKDARLGGVRIVWFFMWIEIVWLSLWVSKIVAKLLPYIFQTLCGFVSQGTRKYALILKALEIPLSLVGWAVASLATFKPIMVRNPTNRAEGAQVRKWQDIVQEVLAAFVVASLIFLAEKFLIQIISINYHRKQFDLKIRESKRNVYLLTLLYDASRTIFPQYCPEFAEEDYVINDLINISLGKKKGHKRSGSGTPMKIIQNVGRVGDKITSVFGNVAQEITGKEVFNPDSAHSVVVGALAKKRSAEALARRLWMSFVEEGKNALYLDDIIEVLGAERRADAEECFSSLDQDGNGDISLDEMILTVVNLSRERRSIATSMHDVDQAINVLDQLLCTVVAIVVIFVFVAFLNKSFTTTLATAGTALLSMSFVFAITAQEILGSCIFLFVKHPYDIGDRVDIGNDQLVVEHISLLFTVFRRVANNRMVQVPNNVLNTNWIENVSRSKAMKEQLSMYISFDTSLEDVQALRNEMLVFVTDKDNSRDFQPDIDVEVTGIAEMNKLELRVEIRHKSNWSNETIRAARRSKFMCALVLALRKIPIYAPGGGNAALGDPGNPTYSVAISNDAAAAQRDEFAAKKEAKRLFPSKKPDPEPAAEDDANANVGFASGNDLGKSMGTLRGRALVGGGVTEDDAVQTLNARAPKGEDLGDDWDADPTDEVATLHGRDSSDTKRGNDLEEVRGLLRRESTVGRRKRSANSDMLNLPLNHESPPTTRHGPYGANTYPQQQQYPSESQYQPQYSSQYQYPTSQSQQQVQPARNAAPTGNAFAQQQHHAASQQAQQYPPAI